MLKIKSAKNVKIAQVVGCPEAVSQRWEEINDDDDAHDNFLSVAKTEEAGAISNPLSLPRRNETV